MIRHILGFARDRDCESVVLEAAKETPAFGFSSSEGFLVKKEIVLPAMPLCLVRRPLAEQAPGESGAESEPEPRRSG